MSYSGGARTDRWVGSSSILGTSRKQALKWKMGK